LSLSLIPYLKNVYVRSGEEEEDSTYYGLQSCRMLYYLKVFPGEVKKKNGGSEARLQKFRGSKEGRSLTASKGALTSSSSGSNARHVYS